jgi:hypothetical protein
VLVWWLGPLGPVGGGLAGDLALNHLGVGFVSLTEALDLTTAGGRAMAAMLAVFASFEREVLQERTPGRPGPCPTERETAGAAGNRGRTRRGNPEIAARWHQQIRNRPPA